MLQQPKPDDYVIATGEAHSVREFVVEAFRLVGLDWHDHVEIDQRYFRPAEVDLLVGDATKAREKLDWEPRIRFQELVRLMVVADLEAVHQEVYGVKGGMMPDILRQLKRGVDGRHGPGGGQINLQREASVGERLE